MNVVGSSLLRWPAWVGPVATAWALLSAAVWRGLGGGWTVGGLLLACTVLTASTGARRRTPPVVLVALWTSAAAACAGGFGLVMSIVELASTGRVTDAAGHADWGQLVRQGMFAVAAVLLAATAIAVRHRNRGTCPHCGAGHPPEDVVGVLRPEPGAASAVVRRVAYVGVAGLVPYVVAKTVVAAGGALGGVADLGSYPGMAGRLQAWGIDVTVVFAAAGALLLLALTHRWGRVFPRWTLVALGWLGAATLAPYGVVLLLCLPLLAAGLVAGEGPVPLWWVLIGGAAFAPLGVALGVATISFRRRTGARCVLTDEYIRKGIPCRPA